MQLAVVLANIAVHGEGEGIMEKKIKSYCQRQHMMQKDYEIYYYRDLDFKQVSLHHHDFYEVYFFVKGDVTYQIEGVNYRLNPADILLVNTEELHQAVVESSNKDYERYVLWLSRDFLRTLSTPEVDLARCFVASDKQNLIRTTLENQQLVRSLLDKLVSLEGTAGFGDELLYRSLITELMVHLNRIGLHEDPTLGEAVKKNHIIDGVIQHVTEHLEEEMDLDALSRTFFLSKYHLSREFKKHTGTTIHRYIVQKRLIRSKELILTGMPIMEVYGRAGFGDYSNFFRAFKKEYGISPKVFYETMLEERTEKG